MSADFEATVDAPLTSDSGTSPAQTVDYPATADDPSITADAPGAPGGASLAALPAAFSNAIGALTTAIRMAAAANALFAASGQLSSGAPLQGTAASTTALSAALLTAIQLVAAAHAVSSAAANMLTAVKLGAFAADDSAGSGTLGGRVQLAGEAVSPTDLIGSIITRIELASAATAQMDLAGSLLTKIAIDAGASIESSATGALAGTTGAAFGASADAEATAEAALSYAGSTIFIADFILAILEEHLEARAAPLLGIFYQRVGENVRYAIDWTRWLARRWEGRQYVVLGDRVRPRCASDMQFRCVFAGYTSAREPRWPQNAGAQLLDGNAVWEAEPLDNFSLAATVDPTSVFWTTSDPVISITAEKLFDGRVALATVNTTAAVVGIDYDAVCQVASTDGRLKSGKLRIKVR